MNFPHDPQISRGIEHLLNMDVRRGLDILGSGLRTTGVANDPTNGEFLLAKLQVATLTRFATVGSVRIDALAQATSGILPYTEQFLIGTDVLGRGNLYSYYDPGAVWNNSGAPRQSAATAARA